MRRVFALFLLKFGHCATCMRQSFLVTLIFCCLSALSLSLRAPHLVSGFALMCFASALTIWIAHLISFSTKVILVTRKGRQQDTTLSRRDALSIFGRSIATAALISAAPVFATSLISPAIAAPCACHQPPGYTPGPNGEVTCVGQCYGVCQAGYRCQLYSLNYGFGCFCVRL